MDTLYGGPGEDVIYGGADADEIDTGNFLRPEKRLEP